MIDIGVVLLMHPLMDMTNPHLHSYQGGGFYYKLQVTPPTPTDVVDSPFLVMVQEIIGGSPPMFLDTALMLATSSTGTFTVVENGANSSLEDTSPSCVVYVTEDSSMEFELTS